MDEPPRILIVDDDLVVLGSLCTSLVARGYEVDAASTAEQAICGNNAPPDVVLLDRRLPDLDGLEVLDHFARLDPPPTIVILTGRSDIASIVEAMRAGAWDYVAKPASAEVVAGAVSRALQHRRFEAQLTERECMTEIVGESAAMRRAKRLLRRIADSTASTILITGETGTGKSLTAKALHGCGDRSQRPFVNLRCSSLPSQLLDDELFGRGSVDDEPGIAGAIERADGGTLFLDEIDHLSLELQAKLLRFIESRSLRRVGGAEELQADVRLVAATKVDLSAAVSEGTFREDLYYRLAVLTVELPPLRERVGDVPLLARHFVAHFAHRLDKPLREVSPRAMQLLESQAWSGNVRELENVIERAALLARGETVHRSDLELSPSTQPPAPAKVGLPAAGVDLRELEVALVRQALSRCKGNITQAGRLLGLNRDQVRYRIAKFGLQDELQIQRST